MKQSQYRILWLDMLRITAVVLVLGRHMPPWEKALPDFTQTFNADWINFGWAGVDLFFVLSGFLVSGLLFREYQKYQELRVWRFLTRRALKIYPLFYLLIATIVAIQVSNYNYKLVAPKFVAAEVLFYQNYHLGIINHTWSLAVEEHFYILLPMLLLLLTRLNPGAKDPFKRLPAIFVGVAAVSLALRMINAFTHQYTDPSHSFRTHLRLDSLFFGVVIAYYVHFHSDATMNFARRFRWLLLGGGLFLISPMLFYPVWDKFVHTFGFINLYLGFGAILLGGLTFEFPITGIASIPFHIVGFLGARSYGIYLWHMVIKIWGPLYVWRWFGISLSPMGQLLLFLVGSVVFGVVISLVVEWPILLLRDRLIPSRSKSLSAAGGAALPVIPGEGRAIGDDTFPQSQPPDPLPSNENALSGPAR